MIKLQKDTEKLVKKAVKNWEKLKAKFKVPENSWDEITTPFGRLYWDNPNILWVLVTDNEENYGGSQTQIGLTKDGRLVWEYQSHCSCNGYETSHDHGTELEQFHQTYELAGIPLDWEDKIQKNITKLFEAK